MLSVANTKLKKSFPGKRAFSFDLPAGKTCPQAGKCRRGCYAMNGFSHMGVVRDARARNFKDSKRPGFVQDMAEEIARKRADIIRIHASGDFYTTNYLRRWLNIASLNPKTTFYAYTKSIKSVNTVEHNIPKNFHVIQSKGGKQDNLISYARAICEIRLEPWVMIRNASNSDAVALDCAKKGELFHILYHGPKTQEWTS